MLKGAEKVEQLLKALEEDQEAEPQPYKHEGVSRDNDLLTTPVWAYFFTAL